MADKGGKKKEQQPKAEGKAAPKKDDKPKKEDKPAAADAKGAAAKTDNKGKAEPPKPKQEPLKAVPKPLEEEMRKKTERLQKTVEDLYLQLNAMKEQEKKERDESRAKYNAEIAALKEAREKEEKEDKEKRMGKMSLQQQLREYGKDFSTVQTRINNALNEIKAIDAMRGAERERLGDDKAASEFKSVAEVDAEIRRLEFDLETAGSSSAKRERTVMKRIKELEDSKEMVRTRVEVAKNSSDLEEQRRTLMTQIKKDRETKAEITGKRDALRAELDAQQSEQKEQEKTIRNKLKPEKQEKKEESERDRVFARIQDLKAEIKATKDKYHEEMNAFRDYERQRIQREKEQRLAESQRRKDEAAARFAAREARFKEIREQKKEEEILSLMDPKYQEIQSCITLDDHLTKQVAKAKQVTGPAFDPAAHAPANAKVLKNEDVWLFGDRTKKKAAPKPKAKEVSADDPAVKQGRPLHFSLQQQQAFDSIGVPMPKTTKDIPDTLTKIRETKALFEKERKTREEVMATMKPDEPSSPVSKDHADKQEDEAPAAAAADEE